LKNTFAQQIIGDHYQYFFKFLFTLQTSGDEGEVITIWKITKCWPHQPTITFVTVHLLIIVEMKKGLNLMQFLHYR